MTLLSELRPHAVSSVASTSRRLAALAALFLLFTACLVEDGPADGGTGGDTTATTVETTPGTGDDGFEEGVVEFTTWAEDRFEVNAYENAVAVFEEEMGFDVDLDMTVNEIPLERLGQ